MTLLEAAKTGKPFKRRIDRAWKYPHHAHSFEYDDLLADDYEVFGELPAARQKFTKRKRESEPFTQLLAQMRGLL